MNSIDLRSVSPRRLLLVGSLAFFLLAVSFVVDIRLVVANPNFGDVTGVLRPFWRVLLAVATLGSFLLAIFNALGDDRPAEWPARTLAIRGENHDIDVHLHGFDAAEREEGPDRDEERPDRDEDRQNRNEQPSNRDERESVTRQGSEERRTE